MHLATIHMTGKEVYKQAVIAMLERVEKSARASRPVDRRHRLRHSAPGEPAHHRSDRRPPGDSARQMFT